MIEHLRWLPNAVTLIRVCLVFPLIITLAQRAYEVALVILVLAAVTDCLDGILARWLKVQSPLGTTLDSAADRLLVLAGFALLAIQGHLPDALFWLVLARDMSILLVMLAFHAQSGTLHANPDCLGRLSTTLQWLLLVVVLLQLVQTAIVLPYQLKSICIALVAISTLLSGVHYAWRARRGLRSGVSAS